MKISGAQLYIFLLQMYENELDYNMEKLATSLERERIKNIYIHLKILKIIYRQSVIN